jgi:hypothetical protein|tara:strand:- start:4836 stop:5036 length:201 start_codon:yes stop_codon:yes gene_type:complete
LANAAEIKEAYRLYWLVKGHINPDENTVLSSADSYFRRLWNNNEASIHEEGFEEAYNQFRQKDLDK